MFDPVHGSQAVHRALVLAFSFPGTPVPVSVSSLPPDLGLEPSAAAVALTLLDPETTFWGPDAPALLDLTGARRRPSTEAAFLFVAGPQDPWESAFREARRGTLSDPHLGATVVAFAPVDGPSAAWWASGPGIEAPKELRLPAGGWVDERNQACREFPLGVDLIWARDDGTVLAVPRSTRLVSADRKED